MDVVDVVVPAATAGDVPTAGRAQEVVAWLHESIQPSGSRS
jgi:hypothetical protein